MRGAIHVGPGRGAEARNKGKETGRSAAAGFQGLKQIDTLSAPLGWSGVRGEAFPAISYIADATLRPGAPTMEHEASG